MVILEERQYDAEVCYIHAEDHVVKWILILWNLALCSKRNYVRGVSNWQESSIIWFGFCVTLDVKIYWWEEKNVLFFTTFIVFHYLTFWEFLFGVFTKSAQLKVC